MWHDDSELPSSIASTSGRDEHPAVTDSPYFCFVPHASGDDGDDGDGGDGGKSANDASGLRRRRVA